MVGTADRSNSKAFEASNGMHTLPWKKELIDL